MLLQDAKLRRPVDLINEDGEIFESLGNLYGNSKTLVCKDAKVQAAFEKDGASNWDTFESKWRLRLTARFRDIFLKSGLASLKGTAYSQYQVQGTNKDVENYYGNWTYTRKINTPLPKRSGGGISYYSTIDLYPGACWDSYCSWFSGAGAWHALSMLDSDRPAAEALGDNLFSPFVAAGWSAQSESNIRPAQWLGMLKLLGIWGAEFYYTGFFSVGAPFPPSENWCYQAAIPAYSQAISSNYADLLFEDGSHPVLAGAQGSYSAGHEATFGPNPTVSTSPWLWAGAPNRIAVARKAAAKELYVIAGAVERKSNQVGNARAAVNVSILLPTGGSVNESGSAVAAVESRLQFEVRLQGSVYVYDASAPHAPAFYQIDAWHEASHPSYWSQHSTVEAEVFCTHLSHLREDLRENPKRRAIYTEVPPGTAVGDYRVFTTFVATCAVQESQLVYYVRPASWVWLRVRLSTVCAPSAESPATTPTVARVGGNRPHVVHAGSNWTWIRISAGTRIPGQSQLLLSVGGSALDLDRFIVTDDAYFSPH